MVFALDRFTKSLVAAQIPYGTEVSVVDHLVGITNVHNSGAAFGVAPAGAIFFLIASVAVAIGLVVYVLRNLSFLDFLALDHLTKRYDLPPVPPYPNRNPAKSS